MGDKRATLTHGTIPICIDIDCGSKCRIHGSDAGGV